jgi:sugar phosphate isomerase/epimerase
VRITNNVEVCWPVMKPYSSTFTSRTGSSAPDVGSMPGRGDGQIKELLAELAAMSYEGCMTMEPHLQAGGQFGGSTGPELFSRAIEAVWEIAAEVGLKCE